MNGYSFTMRVRRALALAREESARLGHEYVGTEHLLLGIAAESAEATSSVLDLFGLEQRLVVLLIEATIERGRGSPAGRDLPYTSRAKKVLELAMSEAREFDHNYVDTEHVFLGLLAEGKGIGAQVLQQLGVSLPEARAKIAERLGSPFRFPVAEPAEGVTPSSVIVTLRYPGGASRVWRFSSPSGAINFLQGQAAGGP
jgi:ATP-dependent Clp protease ATP-binding subunit ClpC